MRDRLLRRTIFATLACAAAAAFTGSLVGIASTEGKLRANGQTAALAAKQRQERVVDRRCPGPEPTTTTRDIAL
jgi:hypothetical protein